MATGNDEEGMPVQIVSVNEDHTFTLNEEALQDILKDVKDLPVVVISIAGAVRQGKSFLLSFFIRYLRAKGASDWLGDKKMPLNGFSWRGGCEADTTGILMWSQPFQIEISSGKTVAVLLMDTQGAFDNNSTVNDCATIFALSTLISSVQIFNIKDLIKKNDLHNLKIFTEYGKLALENSGQKPLQKVLFLVRDWASEFDHAHGSEGGKKYIDKILKVTREQHTELSDVRHLIKSCFEEISCFLMPHPGLEAVKPNFKGCIVGIRTEFVQTMSELALDLFAPKKLIVKSFLGQQIKADQLLIFFKEYMNVFQEGQIPEIQSMFKATSEAINLTAVTKAKDLYSLTMETYIEQSSCIEESALKKLHLDSERVAWDCFHHESKFGGCYMTERWKNTLKKDIEKFYIGVNTEISLDRELRKCSIERRFDNDLEAWRLNRFDDSLLHGAKPFVYEAEDLNGISTAIGVAGSSVSGAAAARILPTRFQQLNGNLGAPKRALGIKDMTPIVKELRWVLWNDRLDHNHTLPTRSNTFGACTIGSHFRGVGAMPGVIVKGLSGGIGSGIGAPIVADAVRAKLTGRLLFHDDCGTLELKPSFHPKNSQHVDQWFKVVLNFITMVVDYREMFVLTWHDVEDIFISEPLDYTIEKLDELSYFKARMTRRFLTDACTSPQFSFSEMAFTFPTPNIVDARKLRGCTKEEVFKGNVNVENEYLCMTSDGGSLFWLNSPRTLKIIKLILKKNGSKILVSG